MTGKPPVVTPTAAISTPNPFAALAEATVEAAAAPVVDIPDDEYLPNQTTTLPTSGTNTVPVEHTAPGITDDQSLSSISTMSSTDNFGDFSEAKISALMERIQGNGTKTVTTCTHTDIANFREII